MSKFGLPRCQNVFPLLMPGESYTYGMYSPVKEGNDLAKKENMTPQAHKKRMEGMFKAWRNRTRAAQGEKFLKRADIRMQKARKRIRLKETVAKEAREIQDTARKRAQAAMDRLQEIIDSDTSKDSDAIAAAQVVLDRAYGKASQTHINANVGENGKNAEITGAELNQRIEKALGRVNQLTGGEPKEVKSPLKPGDLRKRDRNPRSTGGTYH
jgi:hypothetical protein